MAEDQTSADPRFPDPLRVQDPVRFSSSPRFPERAEPLNLCKSPERGLLLEEETRNRIYLNRERYNHNQGNNIM